MSINSIQGQLLEITVVCCNKLKDTEWFSRQDPYVCVEYASNKFRTRTCTDGGKNPTFQEKFTFNLIEGLREVSVSVWNSNTLKADDFIGSGKIQLQKVLSQGYDDCSWTLQGRSSRTAGEVRVIMHYPNADKSSKTQATPSAAPYPLVPTNQASLYATPPSSNAYPPTGYHSYPAPSLGYYPPQAQIYPQAPYPQTYPPSSSPYPPHSAYPPPPQNTNYYPPGSSYPQPNYPPPSPSLGYYPYPQAPYPQTYPPSSSPYPPHSAYPPPPQNTNYYPPGSSYPQPNYPPRSY